MVEVVRVSETAHPPTFAHQFFDIVPCVPRPYSVSQMVMMIPYRNNPVFRFASLAFFAAISKASRLTTITSFFVALVTAV